MRLSRILVAERETFLTDLFKSNPQTTTKDANAALAEKFGKRMRPSRVYAIRAANTEATAVTTTDAPAAVGYATT